jgi:hypothetical protein
MDGDGENVMISDKMMPLGLTYQQRRLTEMELHHR